jgi:hypothetical protein
VSRSSVLIHDPKAPAAETATLKLAIIASEVTVARIR